MLLQAVTQTLAVPFSLSGIDWWGLLTISVSGAFGGFIYVIIILFEGGRHVTYPEADRDDSADKSEKKKHYSGEKKKERPLIIWTATNGVPVPVFIAGQCLVGVGGAYAAALALFAIVRATDTSNASIYGDNAFYGMVISVVAGFIGNRLLRVVGNKLEDQLAKAQADSKEAVVIASEATEVAGRAVKKAAKAEQVSGASRNMTTDVFVAKDVADKIEDLQNKGEPVSDVLWGRVEIYKKKLEGYSAILPCDRSLHIVLANLYSVEGNHVTAIEVLDRFIKCREDQGPSKDNDVASAWLNIACEYVQQLNNGAEDEALKAKAVEALRKTLTIAKESSPEDLALQKSQIRTDCDLNPIREDPGFLQLSEEFGIEKQSPADKAKCESRHTHSETANQTEVIQDSTEARAERGKSEPLN